MAFPRLHPGDLPSSLKTLTSIDWLTDHGALLYTISEHALLSGKPGLHRSLDGGDGEGLRVHPVRARPPPTAASRGCLPPWPTDRRTKIQAVWNDGWNYKGLATAAPLLRRIGHARGAEFAAEAADYRGTFQEAFRRKTAAMRMPLCGPTDAAGSALLPPRRCPTDGGDINSHRSTWTPARSSRSTPG